MPPAEEVRCTMNKQSVKVWQSYNFEDAKYHLFTNLDMYLNEESSGLGRADKDQSEVVFPPGDTLYNGKEFYQLICYHPYGKGVVLQKTSWFLTIEEAQKNIAEKGIPADWEPEIEFGVIDMRKPIEAADQGIQSKGD